MLARLTMGKPTDAMREPDPNYEFHTPFSYALTTWRLWSDHGVTPDGRPYLDQPQGLIDDWAYITHYHNWMCDRLMHDGNTDTTVDPVASLIQGFRKNDTPRLSFTRKDDTP